jgi:phage tail-like protein
MPGQRTDPYRNFGFLVEIDGLASTAFSEVELPESTITVVEYREGAEVLSSARKLPGRVGYSNIVLRRGVTTNDDLWNWWRAVRDGAPDRRNGAIVLLDADRTPVRRWTFREAWPCKYAVSSLSGRGNDVVVECLELAVEGFELDD